MHHKAMTCDPEWIERFLQQQLSDQEQVLFESHLDDCGTCRHRLEAAAAKDDVWSGVREALAEPWLPDRLTSSDDSAPWSDARGRLFATGAHHIGDDGETISRQIVPALALPDPGGPADYLVVVLRSLELIYRKDGPVSKDYGDLYESHR